MSRRPLNIGVMPPTITEQMQSIGLGQLQPIASPRLLPPKKSTVRDRAAAFALQDATRPTGSASPLEGLARVAEIYLKGRGAQREFEREEADRDKQERDALARENALRASLSIGGDDPEDVARRRAETVGMGDPALAYQTLQGLSLGQAERRARREESEYERNARLADAPKLAGIETQAHLERDRPRLALGWYGARTDRMRAEAGGGAGNLRPQEEIRITKASEAADLAATLRDRGREFQLLNRVTRTGPGSGAWGLGQAVNQNRQRMNQITDEMVGYMRRAGEGTVSDADAARFRNVVPNTDVDGAVNDRNIESINQLAQNAEDRAAFLDQVAERGSLRGAESAWRAYTRANPIFDRHGNVRTDRPTFEAWVAAGSPDMSRALAPASSDRGRSLEELVAPVDRRATGGQPGGYFGR